MIKFVTFFLALLIYCNIENVLALSLSDTQKTLIQGKLVSTALTCNSEFPVEIADLVKLKNRKFSDGANMNCFADCFFKKLGVMDNKGMLSEEGVKKSAKQMFQSDDSNMMKVNDFVQTCSMVNNQTVPQRCGRAKLLFNCIFDNASKFGYAALF